LLSFYRALSRMHKLCSKHRFFRFTAVRPVPISVQTIGEVFKQSVKCSNSRWSVQTIGEVFKQLVKIYKCSKVRLSVQITLFFGRLAPFFSPLERYVAFPLSVIKQYNQTWYIKFMRETSEKHYIDRNLLHAQQPCQSVHWPEDQHSK